LTLVVTGLLLGGALPIGGGLAPASAATEDPVAPQPSKAAQAPSDTSPGQAVPSQTAPSGAAPSELAPTAPAPTDDAPAPGPPQTTDPGSVTPPPASAPVIQSPADGQLVSAPLAISGTGTPGGSVQILAGGSSEPVCIATPDGGGAWSCETSALESSSSTSIRAVQITAGGNLADSISVRVLNAPTVTGGPRGSLTNAVVQGRAYPGATVTAVASAFSCSGAADASGAWSCPLAGGITDGDYTVTATQATAWSEGAASPASAPTAIQVDVTVPAAPVLLEPRAGTALPASGAVFRGTGENGATVSVFAGAYSLCQVVVSGGSWSCTAAAIPAGSYNVAVLQQDPAGNVSVQSGALSLTFQDAATNAPGTPTGTAPPTTAPGSPSAPAPGSPSSPSGPGAGAGTGPGPVPGAEGSAPSSPSTPDQGGGVVPPGTAGTPPGTWTDATRFTAALQPVMGAGVATVWWIALVLGALALVLIALPARLLSSTVSTVAGREEAASGRGTAGRVLAGLLGRNRSRHEFERAPDVRISPWVSAGATLCAAAAIVTLSSPVQTQPAYLRLFIAVAAALALVNLMATVPPSLVAKAAFGVVSSARVRPGLLLVSAAAALVSRLADLDPVLVFGLVTGLVVAGTDAGHRVERGRLATVQVLGLLLLGAVAWLVSGAAGVATGSPDVWGSAAAEFLHVVVLASFGASSMLLVPFGRSAGRRILDWSPATWTLLAIASFTALSVLFVPALVEAAGEGAGAGAGSMLVPLIGGIAFAAVCLSAWAWVRFVAVDDDRP
jgi:hypothetical protein